ncbi:MAG: hypothetical protein LUI15_03000 [Firmicutes bacterium]|nr:hypothetical protein [Bacillota bacterium]
MSKKRKIVVTCLAIVLAVTLALGGTITYLTGSSGEVKNEFTKNKNGVELDETTGNEYNIVPGTSQKKDPTITATYTLDSYVFVEVTDATEDLVTWYIANGWTLLSATPNTADGSTTYVYYQLLETEDASGWTEVTNANASGYEDGSGHIDEYVYEDSTTGVTYYYDSVTGIYTAIIHVLEGDKVYYDSSITNADIDSAGDISLTFEAHIIQAEPFLSGNNYVVADGANAAYLAVLGDSNAYAYAGYSAMVNGKLYTDLNSAMTAALDASATNSAAVTVDVVANTDISDTLLLTVNSGSTADITLNLNGNSISYDSGTSGNTAANWSLIRVENGVTLTITGDGTIDGTGMDAKTELIWVKGGSLVVENGTFTMNSTEEAVICASASGTVDIYGGTFKNTASGNYAYGSSLSPLTLNLVNDNPGTITVYGGTFYGNNPEDGDDNLGGTFVATGYSVYNVTGTDAYVVYKSGEAVTISGLSVSNALTALNGMGTTGAVTIEAAEDSSVSASALSTAVASNDVTIDLNNTTLTVSDNGNTVVVDGGDLTISDGTLNLNNTKDNNASAYYSIEVDSNSSLTLDGVTLTQSSGVGIASGASNATLTIKDSTINSTGYYGVGTNASSSTSGVVITIENSTITVKDEVDSYHDSCGVCVNIDATVTITDSTITAERQGIMLRGGTATITNTKITTTAEYSGGYYYTNGGWGSGNEVPMAAIVAGNAKGTYDYNTNLTLNNVTLTVGTRTDGVLVPAIYAATCGYSTTITGASDDDTVLAYVSGSSMSINGATVSSSISSLTKVSDITGTN